MQMLKLKICLPLSVLIQEVESSTSASTPPSYTPSDHGGLTATATPSVSANRDSYSRPFLRVNQNSPRLLSAATVKVKL